MSEGIFFKSDEHKMRFLATMQAIGKVYKGKLDQEYSSALFILTASRATWEKAQSYVNRDGIDIETMLKEVDFSGGYSVLIKLAGNLFNNEQHLDPLELLRLDDSNFDLALDAIRLRRHSMHVGELA